MKISVTFTNLDHTPSLDEHIREKCLKLKRFWNDSGEVFWTCSINNGEHRAEVKWLGPVGEYQAMAHGRDMYESIRSAVLKLEKQLAKEKDKIKNKIHREKKEIVIHDLSSAWGDFEGTQQEEKEKVLNLAWFRKQKAISQKNKSKKLPKISASKKKSQGPKAKSKKIIRIPKIKKKMKSA